MSNEEQPTAESQLSAPEPTTLKLELGDGQPAQSTPSQGTTSVPVDQHSPSNFLASAWNAAGTMKQVRMTERLQHRTDQATQLNCMVAVDNRYTFVARQEQWQLTALTKREGGGDNYDEVASSLTLTDTAIASSALTPNYGVGYTLSNYGQQLMMEAESMDEETRAAISSNPAYADRASEVAIMKAGLVGNLSYADEGVASRLLAIGAISEKNTTAFSRLPILTAPDLLTVKGDPSYVPDANEALTSGALCPDAPQEILAVYCTLDQYADYTLHPEKAPAGWEPYLWEESIAVIPLKAARQGNELIIYTFAHLHSIFYNGRVQRAFRLPIDVERNSPLLLMAPQPTMISIPGPTKVLYVLVDVTQLNSMKKWNTLPFGQIPRIDKLEPAQVRTASRPAVAAVEPVDLLPVWDRYCSFTIPGQQAKTFDLDWKNAFDYFARNRDPSDTITSTLTICAEMYHTPELPMGLTNNAAVLATVRRALDQEADLLDDVTLSDQNETQPPETDMSESTATDASQTETSVSVDLATLTPKKRRSRLKKMRTKIRHARERLANAASRSRERLQGIFIKREQRYAEAMAPPRVYTAGAKQHKQQPRPQHQASTSAAPCLRIGDRTISDRQRRDQAAFDRLVLEADNEDADPRVPNVRDAALANYNLQLPVQSIFNDSQYWEPQGQLTDKYATLKYNIQGSSNEMCDVFHLRTKKRVTPMGSLRWQEVSTSLPNMGVNRFGQWQEMEPGQGPVKYNLRAAPHVMRVLMAIGAFRHNGQAAPCYDTPVTMLHHLRAIAEVIMAGSITTQFMAGISPAMLMGLRLATDDIRVVYDDFWMGPTAFRMQSPGAALNGQNARWLLIAENQYCLAGDGIENWGYQPMPLHEAIACLKGAGFVFTEQLPGIVATATNYRKKVYIGLEDIGDSWYALYAAAESLSAVDNLPHYNADALAVMEAGIHIHQGAVLPDWELDIRLEVQMNMKRLNIPVVRSYPLYKTYPQSRELMERAAQQVSGFEMVTENIYQPNTSGVVNAAIGTLYRFLGYCMTQWARVGPNARLGLFAANLGKQGSRMLQAAAGLSGLLRPSMRAQDSSTSGWLPSVVQSI